MFLGLSLLGLGCAKVVVPKTPAIALDILRIELFFAGKLDTNLFYIIAMNRAGRASNGLDPKSRVAGPNLGENWTDAIIFHDGFWTYYTGDDIRFNRTGQPLTSNLMNTILRWDYRVDQYLPGFGLTQKVLPQGGGKLTLELCKTFFSLPTVQQSQTVRCTGTTGSVPIDPVVSFNFMVSPLHPDRNGSFSVLDTLATSGVDYQIRRDTELNPVAAGRLPNTPNINILGHNSPYERLDINPEDGVPDDLNQLFGNTLPDPDGDNIPTVVETAMETDANNRASVPTFQGFPVVIDELMHPADLTWWRLRQVVPGQQ